MSWSKTPFIAVAALSAALLLNACGYRPLYGQAAADPQVTQHMAAIAVLPMEDRSGQMMRTALQRRLNPRGHAQKLYRLKVELNESLQQLAEQRSGFVTRANLRLSATYTLMRSSDSIPLLKDTTTSVASYNILDSDFATMTAQEDARKRAVQNLAEDMRTRLATYFQGPAQIPGSGGQ